MDNVLVLNWADSDLKLSTWRATFILGTRGRGTNITSDMCFLGRRIHITIYVFPGEGTHNTKEMCFLGKGTNFTRKILCVSPSPKIHIPSDMCSPNEETHIPSKMCSPLWKIHIP